MAAKKKTFWNLSEWLEGDKVVWIIVLMLILISIVCMFSSTSRLLREGMTRMDLLRGQFLIVLIGIGLIVGCYCIKDIKIYRNLSKLGFAASAVLLLLLISRISTPFLKSVEINGARRILMVGHLQMHVFEAVKIMMVMYLAWALDAFKKGELKGPRKDIWKKILYIYAPFLVTILLIIPGSNSSALFIGGIMFILILLGGGNLKDMSILAAAAALMIGLCVGVYEISGHKSMQRIGTAITRIFDDTDYESIYINSTDRNEKQEALDAIRQPISARIAIKEGGFLGKGPGQSTQRYVVPDISEDYMYSFIIEEYGLLGGILVIFLYVSLMARGSLIVRNCGKDNYAKLTVAGLTLLITGQAFLHMFVNADIGPMTGQTLPLISHGDFAFLCFCIAFGVILSFSRIASRKLDRETQAAAPLVEMHEQHVEDGLNDLDAFESGEEMTETLEDSMEDYGI